MAVLVALLVALAATVAAAEEEPPLPEVNTALERIRDASTIELTTVGRRTGKQHTTPIWFVVSDGKIIVQAGKDGKTDWYQNLRKTPMVNLRQGQYTFRARAVPVADPAQVKRIHGLFTQKYMSARFLSWFGSSIGRGAPVELIPGSVAVSRGR
jgi:deazaflavin-dependent oxidoreductase (nitroreductase family)